MLPPLRLPRKNLPPLPPARSLGLYRGIALPDHQQHARTLEAVLQPLRRSAIFHAANGAAVKGRAAFGIVGADRQRAADHPQAMAPRGSGQGFLDRAGARLLGDRKLGRKIGTRSPPASGC